jgi:hypothetical protein
MHVHPEDLHAIWRSRFGDQPVGHSHFWERALTRRKFIGTAVAGGAALGLPALMPGAAFASTPVDTAVLANPINGGTVVGPFGQKHFYFPTNPTPIGVVSNIVSNGTGDPSTIRDFKGTIGLSEYPPTGVVHGDPFGGQFWAADLRFIDGQFLGKDNRRHDGTFAFI